MTNLLSDKQIENYRKIYREYFGRDISSKEALEQGIKLIELMKLIKLSNIKDVNTIKNKY